MLEWTGECVYSPCWNCCNMSGCEIKFEEMWQKNETRGVAHAYLSRYCSVLGVVLIGDGSVALNVKVNMMSVGGI